LTIAFNPVPMTAKVASYSLNDVDRLVVNEVEAFDRTGESHPEK